MCSRDTDKRIRTAFFETVDHTADSHSGVHYHRDCAGFEKCKYDNKKFQAGLHH